MDNTRSELAAAAARLIAEDGLDYGSAKRKAAQLLFGKARIPSDLMPGNEEVETALRDYQQLFQADRQPQRLLQLRRLALELMQFLQNFNPWLGGAVWNGTAGEHSQIKLELYTESGKEVAIFLLNHGLDFETDVTSHFSRQNEVETMRLLWQGEEVVLFIYAENELRSPKRNSLLSKHGNITALRKILAEEA
jgi:hypothetical protein